MFQPDLLKGKHILITGGGSGLGKEMARECTELGANVTICGRRGSVLEEAKAEIQAGTDGTVWCHAVDIRNAADVDAMVGEAYERQPIDGLINNAAGNFISRTADLSPRGFDAIANIVLHGTFYCTQAVGKRWIDNKRSGSIISITTTWVWTGSPYVVPSAMSKAGIRAMTQSLAVEWGQHGIRVNSIAPGPFPTEGAWARLSPASSGGDTLREDNDTGIPLGRFGDMKELRNLTAFLLSDGCDYITGQTIAIDGGQYLMTNGGFARLNRLTDSDWDNIKSQIRQTNEKDKAKRTA